MQGIFGKMTQRFGGLIKPDGPLEDEGAAICTVAADIYRHARQVQKVATDKIQRDEMTVVLVAFFPFMWSIQTQSPSWDPDTMPVSMVKRAMRLYKYDAMHTRFIDKGFGDPFVNTAFGAPAAMHFGDLAVFDECVDFTAKQFKRSVADLGQRAQELQNHFCE